MSGKTHPFFLLNKSIYLDKSLITDFHVVLTTLIFKPSETNHSP
jgi:hypothetical protein